MRDSERSSWIGYLSGVVGILALTLLLRGFLFYGEFPREINTTTVAITYLLIVLIVSSKTGLGPGLVTSIVSGFCLSFFFLRPAYSLKIIDGESWLALFAFLATAVITGQFASAARTRAREAERRNEEVWNLYQLSQSIILTVEPERLVSSIAQEIHKIFGGSYCAVFRREENGRWNCLSEAGIPCDDVSAALLLTAVENVYQSGESSSLTFSAQKVATLQTLRHGSESLGVIVFIADNLKRELMEAIAGRVAMGLERARALQEASRAEALKQSDQLKSAVLASVSHDLRTPLTSIRASVDSLLNTEFACDTDELHQIIREETDRLSRLIENLLEMARIEAGQLRISKQWVAIKEICDNVLDRCAAELRDHHIDVKREATLHSVNVDARLLAEALAHLVENAAKYSPADSKIELTGRVEDNTLIMSIKDDGPGIKPEELGHVFDKFYRGSQRQDHRVDGTGMGLAIAKGIVEAHGGRIWVQSEPGSGATFIFSLPVECREEVVSKAADATVLV
ncbi:MAG TPA: ATP-binding protein [Blastocatellia bacterium]|nr:ATP-binding protein [Blastocatellia bacterium]